MILNSPQNPTGGVLARETLAARPPASCATARRGCSPTRSTARLLYEGEFASIATEPGMLERTIVLDSFSKTYAMTGWRCGYAAVPEPLVEPLTRFLVNSTSCVPPFVQRAGVAALTGPQDGVERDAGGVPRAARPRGRRPRTRCPASPAASRTARSTRSRTSTGVPLDADALADRLLDEAGVALLSGTAFGAAGEGHLRLSYATSRERLAEGLAAHARVPRAPVGGRDGSIDSRG